MFLIKILFMRFITVFVSHLSHIMSRIKKKEKSYQNYKMSLSCYIKNNTVYQI